MRCSFRLPHGLSVLLALALLAPPTDGGGAAASGPSGVYNEIAGQYLQGKWDELSTNLKSHGKEIATLSPSEKSEVDYIRRAVQECRPQWWGECKSGQVTRFRPIVWGHPIAAIFDPSAATDLSISYLPGGPVITAKWNAAEMDDPTMQPKIEFTKGERVDLDIWRLLGNGRSWGLIPPRSQLNLNEAERKRLSRYLEFRGNVAGAYYATPRARRLALWEGISGWSHEYDHTGKYMPMRAIGIFFAAEVLGRPKTYAIVPWPKEPPADGAESKMIWELQEWIRYHELPPNEDHALRDALKAFAATNEGPTHQTGIVTLSNRLTLSLDPDADRPLSVLRDHWIKEQYAKRAGR